MKLYKCTECDSFSYQPDTQIDASSLYTKNYFHNGEYKDYVGQRIVQETNYEKKWKLFSKFLTQPVRLFEIGCAYGFFVDFVRRQGAEKYFGTDISADAIAYAKKNFGHHFDTFTTEVRPPFSYNFMAAWDVWEHMESPYDFFSDVARSLPTGGILAMTTIDSSSFVARFRGLRWRQVHPPTHMHYPTKKALASALKRMNFEIIHHGHYGYYRSLESYLDALKISFLMKLLPRLRHFPIVLDLKDEQFLIARKL